MTPSNRTRSHGAHSTFAIRLEDGGLRAVARRLGADVPSRADVDIECT